MSRCQYFPAKLSKSHQFPSSVKKAEESFHQISKSIPWKPFSVDEYVKIGRNRGICPYFIT